MACTLSYGRSATSTILVLLILLEAVLVMEQVSGAPAQQRGNDILAGTEFLSVFINGAMAPVPVAPPSPRRRGFRRGGGAGTYPTSDNVPAEARQSEASIYRISRAPSSPRPIVTRPGHREESVRLYPINQKSMESRDSLTTLSGEIGNSGELGAIVKQSQQQAPQRVQQQQQQQQKISATLNREAATKSNSSEISVSADSSAIGRGRLTGKNVNQKVIGVSVTSTVEATPYKVRVEHHEPDRKLSVVTRPPTIESTARGNSIGPVVTTTPATGSLAAASLTTGGATTSTTGRPTTTTASSTTKTTTTTTVTPVPAQLVTEELSNIVSESNRSEFSVDEGLPKTSWRNRSPVTTGSILGRSSTPSSSSFTSSSSFSRGRHGNDEELRDSEETSTSLEPVEESYEQPELDSEPLEIHREQSEIPERLHQGRKAGRHYDATLYNQPPKVYPHQTSKIYGKSSRGYGDAGKNGYSQPEVNYGEPARVYSEPAKIYSEPSRIYGEPSKIYGEPAKVYGEPERVYGEPAKVYSEPARIYGEPAKVYSEPAKIYSEPSKIYGADGRPLMHRIYQEEPTEENHEIDEAVSVGSNGNVHGPQIVTEAPRRNSTPSPGAASHDNADGKKVSYVFEDRKYRKYRVEERTSDGFIVGEYGVVSHDDGSLRAVRYTADSNIDPKVIYEALMKFLNLK